MLFSKKVILDSLTLGTLGTCRVLAKDGVTTLGQFLSSMSRKSSQSYSIEVSMHGVETKQPSSLRFKVVINLE